MPSPSSDVAFTPAVKAVQAKRGSRAHFAKMEEKGGWRTAITPDLAGFLAEARSFYLATASADGQPYVQHRGGPPGFVRVIDERTLGFADFKGNRQYITTGNLAENGKAFIFVMDYAQRRRVKIWGRARVVEGDAALLAKLWPEGYKARPEQVIVFDVEAWDTNCPQHIPQMFHAEDVGRTIAAVPGPHPRAGSRGRRAQGHRREDVRSDRAFDGSGAEALRQGFFRHSRSVFQALRVARLDLVPAAAFPGNRQSRHRGVRRPCSCRPPSPPQPKQSPPQPALRGLLPTS